MNHDSSDLSELITQYNIAREHNDTYLMKELEAKFNANPEKYQNAIAKLVGDYERISKTRNPLNYHTKAIIDKSET